MLLTIYGILAVLFGAVVADGFLKIDFDVIKGVDRADALKNYKEKKEGKWWVPSPPSSGDDGVFPLITEEDFYAATLEIGSNKDKVIVLLDTGSADLWVQSSANPLCAEVYCEQFGLYNQNTSTTYHNNGTSYYIQYGDYSFAQGTLGQDTVSIGDFTVDDVNFAVADLSNSSSGVFGIGYVGNEATLYGEDGKLEGYTYANFPVQLKQQGLIDKVSYSLYLTGNGSDTGNIVFGGYDTEKYYGELVKFDVVETAPVYQFFTIGVDSATVTLFNNFTGTYKRFLNEISPDLEIFGPPEIPYGPQHLGVFPTVNISGLAFLDSGTTITYLPGDAAEIIVDQIQPDWYYDGYYEAPIVSCTLLHPENKLTLSLGGGSLFVDIPFDDVIGYDPKNATTGKPVCYYNIAEGNILGDTFLRHVYSVFDLEAKTVYLAPVRHSEDSNIVPIQ